MPSLWGTAVASVVVASMLGPSAASAQAAGTTTRRDDHGLRIGSELGVGLLGAGAVVGLATLLGASVPDEPCPPDRPFCIRVPNAIYGFLAGAAIGAAVLPLFLTLGAEVGGGRGHAGGAYLGFLVGGSVGTAIGLAGAYLRVHDGGVLAVGSVVTGGVLAVIGALVGYELSHHAEAVPIEPALSVGPDGAVLAASGAF